MKVLNSKIRNSHFFILDFVKFKFSKRQCHKPFKFCENTPWKQSFIMKEGKKIMSLNLHEQEQHPSLRQNQTLHSHPFPGTQVPWWIWKQGRIKYIIKVFKGPMLVKFLSSSNSSYFWKHTEGDGLAPSSQTVGSLLIPSGRQSRSIKWSEHSFNRFDQLKILTNLDKVFSATIH